MQNAVANQPLSKPSSPMHVRARTQPRRVLALRLAYVARACARILHLTPDLNDRRTRLLGIRSRCGPPYFDATWRGLLILCHTMSSRISGRMRPRARPALLCGFPPLALALAFNLLLALTQEEVT